MAYLRRGLLQGQKSDPLLIARTHLQEAVELYQQGKRQEAYQKSVDAYLDGFELVEPDLFAKDAALGRELEARFTEFRASTRSGADVTVLFYQALWLQSQATQIFVIWGFLVGVAVLAAIVWSIFTVGMKIPLRLFFGISSALLYLLALVFIGQGIRDLQATGWFRETPLPNLPQIPILGIYPTLETALAQGAMILALIAALFWLWNGAPARANARQW
jgi:hypothetical protein